MPNDHLPVPEFLAEPPKDAGAEVALPDETDGSRRRGVFTEYRAPVASANADDTRALLRTIARLEAAMREAPSQVTANLLSGLAEFGAAIRQTESMLSANDAPAPDAHFAVEHMHDIAMALRMRDVDSALCDTLDTAIREVGDAIVRGEAAAARTQSAASLLRELAHQIGQMTALGESTSAAAPAEQNDSTASAEQNDSTASAPAERFDDTLAQPLADSVEASDDVAAPKSAAESAPLPEPLPLDATLPDKEALSATSEDQPNLFEPSSSLLSVPQVVDDEAAPAREQPSERLTAEIPASLVDASAVADVSTSTHNTPIAPQTLPDISVEAPTNKRAAATDPLAAINALNEEELIALFS